MGSRPGELVITGLVSERELAALYRTCELFVFPSWYEGAGLPILEAMSCGAAVAASGTSSMPELLGDHRATFDPHDPGADRRLPGRGTELARPARRPARAVPQAGRAPHLGASGGAVGRGVPTRAGRSPPPPAPAAALPARGGHALAARAQRRCGVQRAPHRSAGQMGRRRCDRLWQGPRAAGAAIAPGHARAHPEVRRLLGHSPARPHPLLHW